jgi:REP element-mobilizing transposase RayT
MNAEPRGTGVPPEESTAYCGQDARTTRHEEPIIHKRQGNYLPHWTRDGATYAITFRLGDSLPRAVLESWLFERRDILRTAEQCGRPLSYEEEKRLQQLHSQRVESYLDAGHGACWLRQPAIAKVVIDALRYFDGQRYRLHSWCVMPNHVHVVVEPLPGHSLPSILHSWKSFTAKVANRLLQRTGEFWQEESYDHLIRDDDDYAHAMEYVEQNPAMAGLENWPWVWKWEELR